MVTDEERTFLVELLSGLKYADLASLASTSTSGKISPKDKGDAIECILLHSNCAETILKRKKITKDFLFNYLHAKKVNVLVSDEKPRLIQLILQLWNGESLPCPQYPLPKEKNYFGGDTLTLNNSSSTVTTLVRNNILVNVSPQRLDTCSVNLGLPSPFLPNRFTSPVVSPNVPSNSQVCLEINEATVNTLAFKFCEWFYNLLNKNFKGGLIAVNSDHFWNDAEFVLRIKSSSSFNSSGAVTVDAHLLDQEHVKGIDDIIILLNKIKDRYQIYFSPNLCSDGVKGKLDLHGGVLVLACGTLHRDIGQMCGAFEQVFLIFRDPLTVDNWKIKKSELHLISVDNSSSILSSPTINQTTLKSCLM